MSPTASWRDYGESFLKLIGVYHASTLDVADYFLVAVYFVIAIVAAVQLIRIQFRVPHLGFTTQKLFHFLVFSGNIVRAATFLFVPMVLKRIDVVDIQTMILLQLPDILNFSTYSLLVLFWAEIYYQAWNQPESVIATLRPLFIIINLLVYIITGLLWMLPVLSDGPSEFLAMFVSRVFQGVVDLVVAFGFLMYGGRLYLLLRRFPLDSKVRQKKLNEVGWVTSICVVTFVLRCAFEVCWGLIQDFMFQWYMTLTYYALAEALPICLVLFILRKIPAKRSQLQQRNNLLFTPRQPLLDGEGSTSELEVDSPIPRGPRAHRGT